MRPDGTMPPQTSPRPRLAPNPDARRGDEHRNASVGRVPTLVSLWRGVNLFGFATTRDKSRGSFPNEEIRRVGAVWAAKFISR